MRRERAEDREQRVLILAPTGKDGELVRHLLEEDGVAGTSCADMSALVSAAEEGAAALVLAEEGVLDPETGKLAAFLARQPVWSDLPVVILTRQGADSVEVRRAMATLGNVTLLERPTRVAALVSAVRSALRGRARQFQLRAQLEARAKTERLRETELAVTQLLAMAGTSHDALQGILRVVCEHLGWALGAVWEATGDVMTCTEIWHGADDAYPEFVAATRAGRFGRGIGLPGRAWDGGRPLWVPDMERDVNFPRAHAAARAGLRSAFALPIVHGERVVGVMEFLSPQIREPDTELLAAMSTIGAHIGQVLENKRAEERLRRSEAMLTDFFENATVGLHWVGPDGTILRVNRAELEMLGYASDEYVGHSITEFHADEAVIGDILARLSCGEDIADYQARLRCKDGSIKTVLVSSNVLREDGRFIHTRCFTRDITARTLAESELIELRNRLGEDLENMTRLHAVSGRLVQAGDTAAALKDVLEVAIAVTGADMGDVQLLDPATGDLRIVAGSGLSPGFMAAFETVPSGSACCGNALLSKERVVVEDTRTSALLAGTSAGATLIAHGVMAVQSTPLVGRGGDVLGVLSTLWRRQHAPGERELKLIDLLAREAADYVERMQSEATLRERTELLDLAHEAIVVRTPDGRIKYWSGGAEETYGYSAAEVAGRSVHAVLQTRFQKPMARIEAELVRKGRWEGELVQIHKGGREIVTDSRWVLRRGTEDDHVSVLEINRDVTDRRRAEVALRESEERVRERAEELETLMDAVPAVVFVAHDVECRRITGNRAAYEFLRMPPGSNLSMSAPQTERPLNLRMLLSGVECDPRDLPMQAAARGEPMRGEELDVVFEDGQRRYLYGSAIPLVTETGEPRGAIGSFLDITGRKRTEEALRQSERVYRGIGESIEYGVWVSDAQGRGVYASDSFLRLTGMTHNEYSSRSWTELIHPDDRADTDATWRECVGLRQPWYREHRVLGVDGRYHPILARGVPVYDEQGELVCWAGINLDIARLQEAQDSLREADRRKDEFLATLAHELRNPLAPIRTSVQLLRGLDLREPDFTWARNVIDRQTQHLTRLVDDLLDVSRITRGKVELRRERIVLSDVVGNVIDATRALVQASGHRLSVLQPEEPIALDADPVRLAQCLSNLVHNAVKYTPPGGQLALEVVRDGSQVEIRVRDNGIGIPPAELGRVFDMFSQVESALERAQGGLGIGLSIVKSFVEMHGGTVEARSAGVGRGSEFVIRLPVEERLLELLPPRRTGNARGEGHPGTHRILVVDDNRDSAESLSIFLRRAGHDVRTVYDGEKAIEALEVFHPQAVVLDLGLPGLSGFEVARRMRTQPGGSGLLLIAATGWGQAEHLSRSREAGFDHHLVKPIDVLALQALLARP